MHCSCFSPTRQCGTHDAEIHGRDVCGCSIGFCFYSKLEVWGITHFERKSEYSKQRMRRRTLSVSFFFYLCSSHRDRFLFSYNFSLCIVSIASLFFSPPLLKILPQLLDSFFSFSDYVLCFLFLVSGQCWALSLSRKKRVNQKNSFFEGTFCFLSMWAIPLPTEGAE